MADTRITRIKDKIQQHKTEIVLVFAAVGGFASAIYLSKRTATEIAKMTEPARFGGNNSNIIVLENVGDENLWVDMDEPDNAYRLMPA